MAGDVQVGDVRLLELVRAAGQELEPLDALVELRRARLVLLEQAVGAEHRPDEPLAESMVRTAQDDGQPPVPLPWILLGEGHHRLHLHRIQRFWLRSRRLGLRRRLAVPGRRGNAQGPQQSIEADLRWRILVCRGDQGPNLLAQRDGPDAVRHGQLADHLLVALDLALQPVDPARELRLRTLAFHLAAPIGDTSLTPKRRANCVAGYSRRNRASTASTRCAGGTSPFLPRSCSSMVRSTPRAGPVNSIGYRHTPEKVT